MKLNDFFDGIYCINLDERTDRWGQAQKEFGKLGITDVNRFSAIKHEKGAIGCRESHLGVITEAKKLGLKNVLIFEDDLLVIGEDVKKLEETLNDIEELDWDLFYLGATVDPNVSRLQYVTPNVVKTNFAYTTHAYAINSTAFDTILEQAPYHGIIDVFYCRHIIPRGKSYIINPMMCIQQESWSDIEKHHADYWWMVDFFNQIKLKSGINDN
jgi:GR25 family glycosyltransferase involved in LPS biosynthesis